MHVDGVVGRAGKAIDGHGERDAVGSGRDRDVTRDPGAVDREERADGGEHASVGDFHRGRVREGGRIIGELGLDVKILLLGFVSTARQGPSHSEDEEEAGRSDSTGADQGARFPL
jgi:hypothetical protein